MDGTEATGPGRLIYLRQEDVMKTVMKREDLILPGLYLAGYDMAHILTDIGAFNPLDRIIGS